MRVKVLGGGPAGLYFAILMKAARPDTDITVWERNRAWAGAASAGRPFSLGFRGSGFDPVGISQATICSGVP